jgi:hypothetical protein
MLTLINILVIFFAILILYQITLEYFGYSIIEGLDNYKPYDTNNPNNALILAQQNAGNIIVLKGEIDKMKGINQQVQDLSGNVIILQSQVDSLVTAQKDYANNLTGGIEPEITGTTDN